MSELDENHDVFSEESTGTETTSNEEVTDAKQEAKADGEAQQGTEKSEQQGEEGAEPPAANGDNPVQAEKMIPESRFKAAIKDVSAERDNLRRELAARDAAPRPDASKDPQGAALHDKVDASVELAREFFPDYDDVIAHFQEMAKVNPMLNAAILADKAPAKLAYQLAKKDQELNELAKMKDDPDFIAFKAARKGKTETANDAAINLGGKKATDGVSKVPNLNRNATAVNKAESSKSDNDDELWNGHYSA